MIPVSMLVHRLKRNYPLSNVGCQTGPFGLTLPAVIMLVLTGLRPEVRPWHRSRFIDKKDINNVPPWYNPSRSEDEIILSGLVIEGKIKRCVTLFKRESSSDLG